MSYLLILYFEQDNSMYEINRITESNNIYRDIILVRRFLSDLSLEYPYHDIWFEEVANRLINRNREREILFVLNEGGEVIAAAILKNTIEEQKICTLRVAREYQRKGLGTLLVKKSCELLKNSKPIISVSEEKNREFLRLFKRFDFRLTTVYPNKYKENALEYCYNGYLSPETILTNDTTNNSTFKLKKTA